MEVADLTPLGEGADGDPTVVIVEDNAHDAHLLQEALIERGVAVRFVRLPTVRDLLGLMRSPPPTELPRLIIVDLGLPIMSGHEILGLLKSDPVWRSIPQIVFTSSERDSDRAASFAAGAREHLAKPAHFDGFLAIADCLRGLLAQAKETV